jgi:hypothetical protein
VEAVKAKYPIDAHRYTFLATREGRFLRCCCLYTSRNTLRQQLFMPDLSMQNLFHCLIWQSERPQSTFR